MTQYSEETKAAVMAALLEGQSPSFVAKEYKIPRSTVVYWDSQIARPTVSSQKKERIGELIIEYVEAALVSLRLQAEAVGNEKYITRQSAAELAVLHGVIADKAIRILEGIAESDDRETK